MSKRKGWSQRERLKADILRSQIRALLADGESLSKIAKVTGSTYTHVKNIAAQESPHLSEPDEVKG